MVKQCIPFVLCALLAGCVMIQPIDQPAGGGNTGAQQHRAAVSNDDAVDYDQLAAVTAQSGNGATGAAVKNDGYVLRPLDPIYVRFSGILDQGDLQLVIDEKGEINLLHLRSPVKAAGLSPSMLEERIEQLYIEGGIYRNVSVNVTMTSKVYYVQGEVNAPGQFELSSSTTLLQAIAGARGYTPFANKRKITIIRNGRIFGTYNAREIEKDPSRDVKIESGDVIKVYQSWY
jgi:polysaccharide biosynthesis/export protein VpsN